MHGQEEDDHGEGEGLTRNWKARVAYDGTAYGGFQSQPNVRTIQGEIERALAQICQEPIKVIGAGRTDAGVHASGQVINFRTASALDGATIGRGVNALLPADIAVSAIEPVGDEFHARFSATGRTYEYRIRNAPERDPLERHREHLVPGPVDERALAEATRQLVGRRDFGAFAIGPGGVRTVRRAAWRRDGTRLVLEVEADGFLRGMVRGIVGTLLDVARGKLAADAMERIMGSRDRSQAGPSAPAQGLCLVAVEYGERRKGDEGEEDDDGE